MAQSSQVPYLLRATRGELLDRPPVWMMRQAGRYMKAYRDLREKYPSFRERSENTDIAVEISLQPFNAFKPDGVILFSDILTPLPAIGIDFDIIESKGPIIDPPIRTQSQIDKLHPIEPEESLPFIRKILQTLKREVRDEAAVLGFIGAVVLIVFGNEVRQDAPNIPLGNFLFLINASAFAVYERPRHRASAAVVFVSPHCAR